MVEARRLAGDGTEQRRRRFQAVDAFEERGHAGQRDDELRHVARLVERLDGGPNSASAASGSPSEVCKRAASRPMKPSKKLTRCSRTKSTPSSQANSARCGIDLGEGQPDDPQRVGDPVGVAELPSRRDRLVGQGERLLDSTGRLEPVDVRSDPVCPRRPRARRHRAGELHVAIEVAAVHLPECLDEGGVTGLARLVAGLGLELGGSVRVGRRGFGPSDEARVARRRVEAWKTADVGIGRCWQQLLGPRRPSRTAAPRSPSTRRAPRCRSPPPARPVRHSSGTRNEGCRARSPPSRRRRASPGPFQCSHRAAASPPKCAACRSRSRSSPPVSDSCSVGELPDGLEHAVSGTGASVVDDHERLADQRVEPLEQVDVVGVVRPLRRCPPGRIRRRRPTRCAAARARRRSTGRTTTPTACRSVCWRSGRCADPFSSRKRSPSRSLTSTALIAAIRAAASSIPRGRPSRVSQISVTAATVSGSYNPKPGRASHARSTNRVTASDATPPSSARGETDRSVSPATHRYSRDVARILTLPGPTEDLFDGRACSVQHVLAVVHQQQEPPAGDGLGDGVDQLDIALRGDTQCRCNGSGYRRRVTDRSELDHPHTVGELICQLRTDLERQPCLADAPDSTQRDQPVGAHEVGRVGEQRIPTDERAQLLRQVAGERLQAAKRRKRRRETIGDDLMHRHPPTQSRGVDGRRAAGAPPDSAATPRSCRRPRSARHARPTSTAPRGSPRCRSSCDRARSPRRCANRSVHGRGRHPGRQATSA